MAGAMRKEDEQTTVRVPCVPVLFHQLAMGSLKASTDWKSTPQCSAACAACLPIKASATHSVVCGVPYPQVGGTLVVRGIAVIA